MPASMKRTALTQEVVRICRNIRPGLPWEVTVKHLNDFSSRLRASGYDEAYRLQIIKSGVSGFEKMVEVAKIGGRPVNRPRTWEQDQRQKKKELKKRDWFKEGGMMSPYLSHTHPEGS